MDIFLQIWGGSFYLVNKVLFAFAEGRSGDAQRRLKLIGWSIYIAGVPAWIIILLAKHDWIAAAIEFGGLPAMCFGLYNVYRNCRTPNKAFDRFAASFTYLFIFIGSGYSLYHHQGLTTFSQVLEIGVTIGFLLGSYLLAKNIALGWLFFALMNISMGSLMLVQHKPVLALQQGISLCFVLYGLSVAYSHSKKAKSLEDQD